LPLAIIVVSNRNEVGRFDSGGGLAVLGEAFSIAAAYAFERVLKAVGEVGLISALTAVAEFLKV
jgi:hypothetical protein